MKSRKPEETSRWVRRLLEAHGIQVIVWDDGSAGLNNVPAKWCSLISDLSEALHCARRGESLPEIVAKHTRRKVAP